MDTPKYFGPDSTHPALKTLLFSLLAVGLLSGFFYQLFYSVFALSAADLLSGHIWQLFTYPFDLGRAARLGATACLEHRAISSLDLWLVLYRAQGD